MTSIAQAGTEALTDLLRSTGLRLGLGAATLRVQSRSTNLARQIAAVYPHFPVAPPADFSDIHVRLDSRNGLRRFVRPQVTLVSDGQRPFHPFPADTALPLLEWGTNWLIGQYLNHLLLFHAGCLERDGCGLLLPAEPGSGKSTLTAALAHRGWRLLSDEFGVCDPATGKLLALLKPIALKNTSIGVIREFAPDAVIGPMFPKTRKGTVAHVAATLDSVRRRSHPVRPAGVVLPRWTPGRATTLTPVDDETLFRALAFNSFNYEVLGETGFNAVLKIVRGCRGWRLEYSDLEDAVGTLNSRWLEVSANGASAPVG